MAVFGGGDGVQGTRLGVGWLTKTMAGDEREQEFLHH